ncbi:unnamed protein product [Effrenium voratum]|nr:unnamed protein product [Effrenium voratum]
MLSWLSSFALQLFAQIETFFFRQAMATSAEPMSKVILLLGEAAGPLELTRLGLCSRALAHQVFEPIFSTRLCRHLSVDVDVSLEMLSVCLAMRRFPRAERKMPSACPGGARKGPAGLCLKDIPAPKLLWMD